jgi:hypothetical protein
MARQQQQAQYPRSLTRFNKEYLPGVTIRRQNRDFAVGGPTLVLRVGIEAGFDLGYGPFKESANGDRAGSRGSGFLGRAPMTQSSPLVLRLSSVGSPKAPLILWPGRYFLVCVYAACRSRSSCIQQFTPTLGLGFVTR